MVTQEEVYKAIEVIEEYNKGFYDRMTYLEGLGDSAKNDLTALVNMSCEFSEIHTNIESIKVCLEEIKNRGYKY